MKNKIKSLKTLLRIYIMADFKFTHVHVLTYKPLGSRTIAVRCRQGMGLTHLLQSMSQLSYISAPTASPPQCSLFWTGNAGYSVVKPVTMSVSSGLCPLSCFLKSWVGSMSTVSPSSYIFFFSHSTGIYLFTSGWSCAKHGARCWGCVFKWSCPSP